MEGNRDSSSLSLLSPLLFFSYTPRSQIHPQKKNFTFSLFNDLLIEHSHLSPRRFAFSWKFPQKFFSIFSDPIVITYCYNDDRRQRVSRVMHYCFLFCFTSISRDTVTPGIATLRNYASLHTNLDSCNGRFITSLFHDTDRSPTRQDFTVVIEGCKIGEYPIARVG